MTPGVKESELSSGRAMGGGLAPTPVALKAAESLKASGYRSLQNIVVECEEGALVLAGRVPSFYLKQLAQTLAGQVPGVGMVVNRVRVDDVAQQS